MTRLLVECTHVFQHPTVNSGIQRVVRNVIKQLLASAAGVECMPVVVLNGELYRVLQLAACDTPFSTRWKPSVDAWSASPIASGNGTSGVTPNAPRSWRDRFCMSDTGSPSSAHSACRSA